MSQLTVRQAILADLDALTPLFDAYRQFYGRDSDLPAARAFLLARFEHGQSILFIAHDGDTGIGFTQLYPSFSSVSLARTFILNDLFVAAAHRQRGVGSALMAAAKAHAQTLGAIRLSLSTAKGNTVAQSTYAANGWQRDEQFFVYHLPTSL